jgi:hypothetical protein
VGKFSTQLVAALVFLISQFVSAESNFERASKLYQSNHIEQSLALFLLEENSGNHSPQVKFNIASLYLKLRDYPQAEKYYLRLRKLSKWKTAAEFYLGLIAEKNHQPLLAKQYFTRVSQQNTHPKLRLIAHKKLIKKQQPPSITSSKNALLLSLNYGLDSNPIAISESFQIPSSQLSDTFIETMVFARTYELPSLGESFYLQGYFSNRQHGEFDSLDTNVFNAGLFHLNQWYEWRFNKAVNIHLSQLDGQSFYQQVELRADFQKRFDETLITTRFIPGYFHGSSGFGYLTGNILTLQVDAEWTLGQARLIAGYTFETNNRKGIETEENSFSYSPHSHSLSSKLKWDYSQSLSFTFGVEYIVASYSNEDRLLDSDLEFKQAKRQSDLFTFQLQSEYKFSPELSINVNYQSDNNSENFDLYDYQRSEFSLGIDYHAF